MTDVGQRPVRWADQQRWWEQYERESPLAEKLRAHLSLMVPLRIAELHQQGGPSTDDYEHVRGDICAPGLFWGSEEGATWGEDDEGNANTLVCHGGEALLFPRSFDAEHAQEWRRKLVEMVAVLAFAPRGIHIFGLPFCAAP